MNFNVAAAALLIASFVMWAADRAVFNAVMVATIAAGCVVVVATRTVANIRVAQRNR